MTWQQNLFNNLLVIFILTSLGIIVYTRVKGINLVEFFKEIKELLTPNEEI